MNDKSDKKNALVRDFALKADLKPRAKSSVEFDSTRYAPYLEGSDLTDAQKEDVIRALWSIIVAFVDLGFDIHPVQHCCGQLPEVGDKNPAAAPNRIQCEHSLEEGLDSVAGPKAD